MENLRVGTTEGEHAEFWSDWACFVALIGMVDRLFHKEKVRPVGECIKYTTRYRAKKS